jgi:excisionase family DNA binding protein
VRLVPDAWKTRSAKNLDNHMPTDRTDTSPNGTADLLYGMQAIADFLGVKRSVAYHLAAAHRIPTFKVGRTVCARRSRILAALDALDSS